MLFKQVQSKPVCVLKSNVNKQRRLKAKIDIMQLDSVILLLSCDAGDDYNISISRNPFFFFFE